jgi:hypothetical protein
LFFNTTKTTYGFSEDLLKFETALVTDFNMVTLVINDSTLAIIFFVTVINWLQHFPWRNSPKWAMASLSKLRDHTQTHETR